LIPRSGIRYAILDTMIAAVVKLVYSYVSALMTRFIYCL